MLNGEAPLQQRPVECFSLFLQSTAVGIPTPLSGMNNSRSSIRLVGGTHVFGAPGGAQSLSQLTGAHSNDWREAARRTPARYPCSVHRNCIRACIGTRAAGVHGERSCRFVTAYQQYSCKGYR